MFLRKYPIFVLKLFFFNFKTERPVHNFEVIGDVFGQWQNWDDADARTAVLLVRQEHLCTQLRDHVSFLKYEKVNF